MKNKPFVIFIDGADGVGKSTLTKTLVSMLSNNYPDVKVGTYDIMRSTDAGGFIRSAMINEELDETLRYNGFMYGVFYGLKKLYKTKDRDIIICDRSQATTYAYNICAPDMSATIKNAQVTLFDDLNTKFFVNHGHQFLNVHLHVDPETAFMRMKNSRENLDVIEQRGVPFQEQVERGLQSYFNKHAGQASLLRFHTGSDSATPEEISADIIHHLKHRNVV